MKRITKQLVDELSYQIIGAAIEVHKHLGPGLLESIYHTCMNEELKYRGIPFVSELVIPIQYRDVTLDALVRADVYADNLVVAEYKAVEKLVPVHDAQTITYMKLLKAPKSILINFNVTNIVKEGQRTFVSEYYRELPDV